MYISFQMNSYKCFYNLALFYLEKYSPTHDINNNNMMTVKNNLIRSEFIIIVLYYFFKFILLCVMLKKIRFQNYKRLLNKLLEVLKKSIKKSKTSQKCTQKKVWVTIPRILHLSLINKILHSFNK
jgi:hypothetical protein